MTEPQFVETIARSFSTGNLNGVKTDGRFLALLKGGLAWPPYPFLFDQSEFLSTNHHLSQQRKYSFPLYWDPYFSRLTGIVSENFIWSCQPELTRRKAWVLSGEHIDNVYRNWVKKVSEAARYVEDRFKVDVNSSVTLSYKWSGHKSVSCESSS